MAKMDFHSEELQRSISPFEASSLEVSIVMPCLNEAETLATCIEKAQQALQEYDIAGEVIVADNGSTDGSQMIASRKGARVVEVEAKGYVNALMGGSRRHVVDSSLWEMWMTAMISWKFLVLSRS
jgi:cellulose synthase/poly-beta-1,6-N-acetylglucosamine synthase-like glycosyltransferase